MSTRVAKSRVDLLEEITPDVERLYNRHMEAPRLWYPHEQINWGDGEDFKQKAWAPEQYPIGDGVRSSIYVNLLTEDNLPYYTDSILAHSPRGHPIREWTCQWTMEENRHAMVMRDYLIVTRALDPVALERARMAQMCAAVVPEPESVPDALSYVALQELATRISHRNTGKMLSDSVGTDVMARVAADENLHYLFYRDLVTASLALDPSRTVCAIERQVREFEMPGVGIIDFAAHAKAIAQAGIYDLVIHHEQIQVGVVLRHWKIDTIEGLDAEGEKARDALVSYIERVGRVARRLSERRGDLVGAAAG